jgi:hypothetical protein
VEVRGPIGVRQILLEISLGFWDGKSAAIIQRFNMVAKWLPKNVTKAIILLEIVEIIHSTRCTEYLLTKSMTYCEGSKTVKRPYFLSYMNLPIAGVFRRGATSL